MKHPFFLDAPLPRVFAHRGLHDTSSPGATVWENTAAAVAAAHAAGATYVETDCRVTASGDVILFHDADLMRLFGDSRRVREVRTHELEDMLAPYGGLLRLSQALEAFPTVRFNIDVKEDAVAERIGPVVVEDTDRVLLTSFDDAQRQRALAGVLAAGAAERPATSAGRGRIAKTLLRSAVPVRTRSVATDIDALQVPERHAGIRVLSPAFIRHAHALGLEVHAWTINDPTQMNRLLDMGVDGIVTDRADIALKTLSERPG